MRIKTNLTATELKAVSTGLDILAKSKLGSYEPENPAEDYLLRVSNDNFRLVLEELKQEIQGILEV